MSEKYEALLEMKAALEHLREAWFECLSIFTDARIECNNYIMGDKETENEYPFHMSFDEIMTLNWCDGCIKRIEKDLEKKIKEDSAIKRATAIYSGGGIYLYYAEQYDGNWIMGNDDNLIIVNTNPLQDENTFEDSQYWEWIEPRLVREIPNNYYKLWIAEIIHVIEQGNTIKEYDNFSIRELKLRLKE